jgi:putative hydrolase of the HAD superfamily
MRKSIPIASDIFAAPVPEQTAAVPRPQFVFFDVGDTLVAPHPSFAAIFAAGCREAGVAMRDAEAQTIERYVHSELAAWRSSGRSFSVTDDTSRCFWQGLYGRFLDECGRSYPASLPEQLYERFRRSESYQVFPDVREALQQLRAGGFLLGVLSNWEAWLGRLLDDLGLKEYFSVLLVSGVEGKEKPDPELFRRALARAGVSAELAVHVGDSPESDCAPALAAGMQAVLLDRRGLHTQTPYRRMRDLAQLTHWLGQSPRGDSR